MDKLTDFDDGRASTLPSGQALCEYAIVAADKTIEVAPEASFPAWTHNSGMRGPTIRCTEGERIRISFAHGSTRNRASARLMADGLKCSRSAARATLPSVSTASMVPLRFGILGYFTPLVVITADHVPGTLGWQS